jgi:hypothetical protein
VIHLVICKKEQKKQDLNEEERKSLKKVKFLKQSEYIPEKQQKNRERERKYYKSSLCMGKRKHKKGPNPLSFKNPIKKKKLNPQKQN